MKVCVSDRSICAVDWPGVGRAYNGGSMRMAGPWNSFVFFQDPDENSWAVQERAPAGPDQPTR